MRKISAICVSTVLPLFLITTVISCKHAEVPVFRKQVQLQTSPTLGTYLADKDGRTLYMSADDANGQPSCSGACEATWPAFNVDTITDADIDTTLKKADFTVVTTAAGKKQLRYKGWPLYYHAPAANGTNTPEKAGATAGEGVGSTWFIAKPDYSIMFANAQLVGHNGRKYKSDYTEGEGKTMYLTDGSGLTLYAYRDDRNNKNNYTRADFSNNPIRPIYETDKIVVPSVLNKSEFAVIDVFGRKQLTYRGWPLYYFGQDVKVRGANKGISFPAPAMWPVVGKDTPTAP